MRRLTTARRKRDRLVLPCRFPGWQGQVSRGRTEVTAVAETRPSDVSGDVATPARPAVRERGVPRRPVEDGTDRVPARRGLVATSRRESRGAR
ncbi:hypothetical protein SGRIM128S_08603 [Streptomyces griseomycini]|nr:hypothetical protein GCM10015536_01790 [Streptomyces griseomycini]